MSLWEDYDQELDDEEEHFTKCTLVHETPKAWLIEQRMSSNSVRQAWFPKSQCDWHPDRETLVAPHWMHVNWKRTIITGCSGFIPVTATTVPPRPD